MNNSTVKRYLKNDVDIIIFDEIPSSNSVAKELAKEGAAEFTTVVAIRQTHGRGRLGRSFISNSENGLYMSIILKPDISPDKCIDITALAAVAALESIENTSHVNVGIKWVNDIYINEKKVCGILTEASFNNEENKPDYVICGIGVNITPPENGFDAEIKDIAGAIFESASSEDYKEKLCASIIDTFIKYYKEMDRKTYMAKYKSRSCILGESVDVYRGNEIISGVAIDINDNAELVVQQENGAICVFNSGEARVRKSGNSLNEK